MMDLPLRLAPCGIRRASRSLRHLRRHLTRITFKLLAAVGLLLGCGGGADRTADREPGAAADQPQTDTMAAASTATADTASDGGLTWAPSPPGLPAGARVALVSGNPAKAGPFTIRVDMPPDYAIRPHHHPTGEELRLLED
jgi:hypothetical protein